MGHDEQESTPSFLRSAEDFWKKSGGRMTVVRRMICESADKHTDTFGADQLWKEVTRIDPLVSLTSIYRTLADLVTAKLLREIHTSANQRLFVKAHPDSSHTRILVCKDCHRIIPLDDDTFSPEQDNGITKLGFDASCADLHIEASCQEFKISGACSRQAKENNPSGQ